MQILKALAAIGITRENLTSINTDEIIRIEKKLTAESRLNGVLTKNDISRIVNLLKDYPDVLQWLCHYQCLYGILVGVDADLIDTVSRHPPEEAKRIREALATYFYDDLLIYINLNFNAPDWNNLRVLVHYKELLPVSVHNVVFQRLQSKLDFGFNELKRHASQKDLDNNSRFLTDKQFFMLLSDVDLKYFERYINAIATFLKHNRALFANHFLGAMIGAMRYFDGKNLQLDYYLRSILGNVVVETVSRRKPWSPYVGLLFLLISILRFCANSGSTSYSNNNQNYTYDSPSALYQKSTNEPNLMDSAKIKMERFVEARYFPLNYPLNSWKASVVKPAKYANPFATDIFQSNSIGLRHDFQNLNLFNKTYKECIVIAYYPEYYDIYSRQYTSIQEGYPPFMYAIYIPPGDSIKIDFKMTLLRFYMGRSLKEFNTYRNKLYPDSSDIKFAKYTPADSLLFSAPFIFNGEKLKSQSIIISQPSADRYQLQWTGSGNMSPFNPHYYRTDQPDSATSKKALILRVDPKNTDKNTVPDFNSFLERD